MACNLFILWFLSILIPFQLAGQKIYSSNSVKVGFFSSAPIEDIRAVSDKGISVWNVNSDDISFLVQIETFQFRKAKMQAHFNENFMESHKYPYATFKGTCSGLPGELTNGTYDLKLQGELEVKGKKQARELPATVKVEDGKLYFESEFEVACEDHDIEIPRVFWKNIAEVIEVEVEAIYVKK